MFLRVKFSDNDFSTDVKKACEQIMLYLSNGYRGSEAVNNYQENRQKYGLEAIRKSIVLSSYGNYIAHKGARSFYKNEEDMYDVSKHENILVYLDENISLEEVKSFKKEWENSEVCYMDFYTYNVHLQ